MLVLYDSDTSYRMLTNHYTKSTSQSIEQTISFPNPLSGLRKINRSQTPAHEMCLKRKPFNHIQPIYNLPTIPIVFKVRDLFKPRPAWWKPSVPQVPSTGKGDEDNALGGFNLSRNLQTCKWHAPRGKVQMNQWIWNLKFWLMTLLEGKQPFQ